MNVQRAARWSGSGICNGRLRLAADVSNARYYSFHAHKASSRTRSASQILRNKLRIQSVQQTRSISLFGWGSSTSKPNEFAAAHAPPQANPPSETVTDAATSSPPSIEKIHSIKASHATSDVPDPSVSISTEIPHTSEPALLKDLENAIANPGGHSPEVVHDVSQVPESLGYLKEACGLDYGWGTTTLMQQVLETIHITGGFSWAGSIIGMAVAYRILVGVFVYRSADQAAKLKSIGPAIAPLRAEMTKATAAGDMFKRQQVAAEIQAINKEIGFNPLKLFLPIAIQIPLGFSGFRLLRGCADAPVPAFVTESWLWNVDLTMSDPYYIMPVLQAGMLWFSIKMSQKAGVQALSGGMGAFIRFGLPAVSAIWSTFQPGSVQLFFLTSTAIATVQGWALQQNTIRRFIRLMPMPQDSVKTDPPQSPGGMTRFADLPGKGKVIDVKPTPSTSGKRSTIDKVVDSVKAKVWDKSSETYKTKVAERRSKLDLQKTEKYEYRRKQETEYERDIRNRAKESEVTSIGPGGMRILKKQDLKKRSH